MIDRKKFFALARSAPFGRPLTQGQVDGISKILDEWERRALTDLRFLAYMLATVFWECDRTMQPIKEGGSLAYLKSKKYYPWYGRGLIQLTWKYNYVRFRDRVLALLGLDIVAKPDNALDPKVAVFIMFEGMLNGEFTGKRLSQYFNSKITDWVNARRIINGTDRAALIAGFAKQFHSDLVSSS